MPTQADDAGAGRAAHPEGLAVDGAAAAAAVVEPVPTTRKKSRKHKSKKAKKSRKKSKKKSKKRSLDEAAAAAVADGPPDKAPPRVPVRSDSARERALKCVNLGCGKMFLTSENGPNACLYHSQAPLRPRPPPPPPQFPAPGADGAVQRPPPKTLRLARYWPCCQDESEASHDWEGVPGCCPCPHKSGEHYDVGENDYGLE